MDLEPKHFGIGLVIILMLVIGIPLFGVLTKKKPDYEADGQALSQLQQGVNAYARQAGRFPLELNTLVPNYVASIPKTSTGEDFVYNYQTGQVTTPYPPPKGMAKVKPASGSGVPAMGDAITGLSVQNELNF